MKAIFRLVHFLKIGFYGFLISFLGTLPISTINITAFNIAALSAINETIGFIVAVVFIELLVVFFTLIGNEKINFNSKFFLYVIPIGAIVLLYMAVHSFIAASTINELDIETNIFPGIQSPFLLGVLLSISNPLGIPFWLAWNRVLTARGVLIKTKPSYFIYALGIAIGTLIGLLIYVFAGSYIFQNYNQYSMILNLSLGVLYLGFFLYVVFLLYKKHLKFKIQ